MYAIRSYYVTAVLDGDNSRVFVLNDYFLADKDSHTSGSIVYPLSGLEPGEHTLKFVITSYSIHYTKLYDTNIRDDPIVGVGNPTKLCYFARMVCAHFNHAHLGVVCHSK